MGFMSPKENEGPREFGCIPTFGQVALVFGGLAFWWPN